MTFVRIAELEIDPALLDDYTTALKDEIETSVRVEAGVLAIYAVAERDDPAKMRLLEIYADKASYDAHVGSVHFKTYKAATKDMVRALRLIDTTPVLLSAKE
jgi:quinol monooxygenase YgiN